VLNAYSPDGGAILESSGNFRRGGLVGGNRSLVLQLERIQVNSREFLFIAHHSLLKECRVPECFYPLSSKPT
jgi:hypothetical protein